VLGDERSGSGPDLFRVGRFIPGADLILIFFAWAVLYPAAGRVRWRGARAVRTRMPASEMRGARGAGADARAQLCPSRRCFDAADLYI